MGGEPSQYELDMMAVRDRLIKKVDEDMGMLETGQNSLEMLQSIYQSIEYTDELLYEIKNHLMKSSENTSIMVDILREISRMVRKSSIKHDDPGEA